MYGKHVHDEGRLLQTNRSCIMFRIRGHSETSGVKNSMLGPFWLFSEIYGVSITIVLKKQ